MTPHDKSTEENSVHAIDTENYSEEVQAIIDRMPTTGSKYIALITAVLICATLAMGFVIKYSDSVDGEISVTSQYSPVKAIAKSSGSLHLLKDNNTAIRKNEAIAWIDNTAAYDDVLKLKHILSVYHPDSLEQPLPEALELGEINNQYGSFLLAHKQYARFQKNNTYDIQRINLQSQIQMDSIILDNIEQEIMYRDNTMQLHETKNQRDSALYMARAITESDMIERHLSYLQQKENYQSLMTEKSSLMSKIHSNQISIIQLHVEEQEKYESYLSSLLAQLNELRNSISAWEQKYIISTPIDGQVEYLGFWKENVYVQLEQPLFSIIPPKGGLVGEVFVPTYGIGKVKVGQRVNVKINNYPYDEYGSIDGVVESISQMTQERQTATGNIEGHLVVVSFPEGSKTNFGIDLDLNFETKGTAEIITKPKRLIQRLFDNLKYKVTAQ